MSVCVGRTKLRHQDRVTGCDVKARLLNCESEKTCHPTSVDNFGNYQALSKNFSLLNSAENLQRADVTLLIAS